MIENIPTNDTISLAISFIVNSRMFVEKGLAYKYYVWNESKEEEIKFAKSLSLFYTIMRQILFAIMALI